MKTDKNMNGFYIVFTILAVVSILLLLYGIVLVKKEIYIEKKEKINMKFYIENVNLVQYSDNDSLTGYVYLIAPNEKKETVKNLDFYNQAKKHIGQQVELQVTRTYMITKDGQKKIIKEKLSKPIKVLGFSGEEREHTDTINNVEIHTRPIVIPVLP